jgi:hypothetical protein
VTSGQPIARRFPMIRQGGLFITCVGVGLIVATYAAQVTRQATPVLRPVFFLAVALGVTGLFGLRRRLSLGRPTRPQLVALWIGLGFEGAMFALLPRLLGRVDLGTFWLAVLIVVGLHFLPLTVAFGPRCGFLGILCVVLAAIGLEMQPYFGVRAVIAADGALKTAFGLSMVLYPFGIGARRNKPLQPTSDAGAIS